MILALMLACNDSADKTLETGDTGTPAGQMEVSIPFRARAGGVDFACGGTLSGMGTGANALEPRDFRFYVYDLALIDSAGEPVLVSLDQDGTWQSENVALLDFEDGSGRCATGSPDTNTELRGLVAEGDYTGISFNIGVPDALNHIDAATAPAPLNDTSLWWSWTGGYKFAKIDMTTEASTTFVFHLGATDCEKLDDGSYACTLENQAAVTLVDFDVANDAVALDLADLYAENDLSGELQEGDSMPGCMSSEGDPECTGLFGALGLPWGDNTAPGEQRLFTVEAR